MLDAGPISRLADDQFADSRTARLALLLFASFGCVLASAGIYAVAACSVAARRAEFGVRMALGARPSQVANLVTRQSLGPVAIGMACGVATALGLTRLLRSLLFEIRPTDPVTFVVVPLLFASIALAASALPARRAASVDPATTLRAE